MMKVWLVWENAAWQGSTLHGVYSTREKAETVCGVGDHWEIEEIDVDQPTNSWRGN